MHTRVLLAYLRPLPEYLPQTKALETATGVGVGFDGAWYRSQKQHWLGWVSEYHGKGAYGRSDMTKRDAQSIYNRIQCAPMLFWLAEALELPEIQLEAAFEAVTSQSSKGAKQCAALRNAIPWQDIEAALDHRKYGKFDRLRLAFALRFN